MGGPPGHGGLLTLGRPTPVGEALVRASGQWRFSAGAQVVSWLVRRHHGRVTTTYTGADPEALLAEDASEAVTVRWHDVVTEADAALRMHVAAEVGVPPESVTVGRLCGRCGSPDHGRPWASHGVHVSLARSGPHLVTAVSTTGPVGVDVEYVENVDRAWRDLSAAMDLGTARARHRPHGAVVSDRGRAQAGRVRLRGPASTLRTWRSAPSMPWSLRTVTARPSLATRRDDSRRGERRKICGVEPRVEQLTEVAIGSVRGVRDEVRRRDRAAAVLRRPTCAGSRRRSRRRRPSATRAG